tara:strand:- start:6305 stop:6871 length:567 start_codon:yes stop_codon:yes gene_type:complete
MTNVKRVIQVSFLANYKTADNISFNFRILCDLYQIYYHSSTIKKIRLRKPIIILIVSICEAILYDFIFRIRKFTNEGVTLPKKTLQQIQSNNQIKFGRLIGIAQSNNVFQLPITNSKSIYKDLTVLKEIRDRVHIQWPGNLGIDESAIYTAANMKLAEDTLDLLISTIEKNHPRPGKAKFIPKFNIPW